MQDDFVPRGRAYVRRGARGAGCGAARAARSAHAGRDPRAGRCAGPARANRY